MVLFVHTSLEFIVEAIDFDSQVIRLPMTTGQKLGELTNEAEESLG